MAYEYAFYYYKHFSKFSMDADCTYDSENQRMKLKKVRRVHMRTAGCAEHHDGFTMPLDRNVKVDTYHGFWVVRIGVPKTIYLPDEKSHSFMRDDLKKNHGVMAYWDYASIAFVTNEFENMVAFKQFLEDVEDVTYCQSKGIDIS